MNNKYLIYYREIEEGNEYYILDIENMNIVYTSVFGDDYEHRIFNNFFKENEISNSLIIKNIDEIENLQNVETAVPYKTVSATVSRGETTSQKSSIIATTSDYFDSVKCKKDKICKSGKRYLHR